MKTTAATALACTVLFASAVSAQNAPTRVLVSAGVRAVVEELKPQCERALGHPLSIEVGSTTDLRQKIESGEAFDVAILTTTAIDALAKTGKTGAGTPLARAGIGVGIHAGDAKPDISTPEAFKRALLHATTIAYAGDGASRTYIDSMFQKMDIANDLKPTVVLTHGSAAAGEKAAATKGGIVLTLVSEILPMKGVQLVGPFPSEVQNYIYFSAAAKGNNPDAAKLIAFLSSPSAASIYKAKGMEPGK
jgi:molybdate transport system substrate-binding protein